jgi:hypothetical protein
LAELDWLDEGSESSLAGDHAESSAIPNLEKVFHLCGTIVPKNHLCPRRLWRICHSLAEQYGGSLDSLAAQSEQLEDLAARLARLAPGFGAASVARFLRPLRDRWVQASEIPLHPAARAAAVHLGLLAEGEDEEGEPGALRATIRDDPEPPSLADTEAALTRIGSVACSKNRTSRCPLGDACPRHTTGSRTEESNGNAARNPYV